MCAASEAPAQAPVHRREVIAGDGCGVRLGWGLEGALALAPSSDVVVVVDVISFSTTVTVALERGCTVFPCPWDESRARALAASQGAVMAVARARVDAEHPYSLSPVTLSRAPAGARVVLPSPNGGAIVSALGELGARVLVGGPRNAYAVARLARRWGPVISVIAAGERSGGSWVDPALEDLLGAGAVIDGLRRRRRSPEAVAAAAAFLSARRRGLRLTLRECVSGRELRRRGLDEELEFASPLNVTSVVPVLRQGALVALSGARPWLGREASGLRAGRGAAAGPGGAE